MSTVDLMDLAAQWWHFPLTQCFQHVLFYSRRCWYLLIPVVLLPIQQPSPPKENSTSFGFYTWKWGKCVWSTYVKKARNPSKLNADRKGIRGRELMEAWEGSAVWSSWLTAQTELADCLVGCSGACPLVLRSQQRLVITGHYSSLSYTTRSAFGPLQVS